jgi:ribose transport system substrate-binding protein
MAGALSIPSTASNAEGTGTLQGDGKAMVMFVMTASNVYGANQINGAKQEAERLGWDLTVFQHNFSQPEQDGQVQQYIASGAQPEVIIFWPWVADAAINAVRQLARLAPVIQLTQEPNEQS